MIFVEWSQVLPTGNSHKSFLYLDLLQTISDTSPAFFSISCQVNSDTRVSFISVSVRLLLTLEIPSSVSLSGYFWHVFRSSVSLWGYSWHVFHSLVYPVRLISDWFIHQCLCQVNSDTRVSFISVSVRLLLTHVSFFSISCQVNFWLIHSSVSVRLILTIEFHSLVSLWGCFWHVFHSLVYPIRLISDWFIHQCLCQVNSNNRVSFISIFVRLLLTHVSFISISCQVKFWLIHSSVSRWC